MNCPRPRAADGESNRSARAARSPDATSCTSRLGAAVQINAFNFPVWGMLEKSRPRSSPGCLGGQPGQPDGVPDRARRTAHRRLRPASRRSMSLLARARATCLSSWPRRTLWVHRLRGNRAGAAHPSGHRRPLGHLQRRGRLPELSILAPDVSADDPEFDLYVDQIVTEMTVKAGQKCTAIRRAFVPTLLARSPRCLRLAWPPWSVGHLRRLATTMGALASLAQRRRCAPPSRTSVPPPHRVRRPGQGRGHGDADSEQGAFLSPSCCARRPRSRPPPSRGIRARRHGPSPTKRSTRRSAWPRRARAAWPDRSSPATQTWLTGSASDWPPGTAACSYSTAATPRNPQVTVSRCHRCCTAAPDGPAAAPSSAVCARYIITCSAPRCRATRTCSPASDNAQLLIESSAKPKPGK